ncbi:MAG TPA: RraA family protein [Candidatus Limnocylindrales bacterium]|nr:RraA family protein [Candidatus Limnocylindrales bacterium]
MDFKQSKEILSKLDTACLSDANKNLRVLDSGIRPIRSGLKLIGIAHTVSCYNDFLTVIKALKDAQPGEVLVIDGQGGSRALVGELFTREALRKGLAGIIVDGACRDTWRIRTLQLPVYARSISPLSGTTSRIFDTQIPITCGGVTVNPGDIVFGDEDGILVASLKELSEALPIAQEIQSKEEEVYKRMDKGESLLDMLNFDEHYAKVSGGQKTSLKFIL